MRYAIMTAAVAMIAAGAAAHAQARDSERPAALKKLVDCRSITEPSERLACYDREVAAVDAAAARQDLVVVDRDQVRKTKRSLFGFSLPDLAIFGDDAGDDEESSVIETTIKRSWETGNGKWGFELADGARWVQTDSRNLASPPKAGQPIKIRKAALGSYLANVNKQVAIRVRRIQ